MSRTGKLHGVFSIVLKNRYPGCRKRNLFTNNNPYRYYDSMKLNTICHVCEQKTKAKERFYYETGDVSYILTIILAVCTLLMWQSLTDLSRQDDRFFCWLLANGTLVAVLQPYRNRISSALWSSAFVPYDFTSVR